MKANCIRHILRRSCLLKHFAAGNVEGMERWGRRRKQLLDEHTEKSRYLNLKAEVDHGPYRIRLEVSMDLSQDRLRLDVIEQLEFSTDLSQDRLRLDVIDQLEFSMDLSQDILRLDVIEQLEFSMDLSQVRLRLDVIDQCVPQTSLLADYF